VARKFLISFDKVANRVYTLGMGQTVEIVAAQLTKGWLMRNPTTQHEWETGRTATQIFI
jgi:hypothetical protein